MKTLSELEEEVRRPPRSDKEALLGRLEDLLEDELDFTDEFNARIAESKADMAAGHFSFDADMSSWSGRGTATLIYTPGYDAEFWTLPAGLQAPIEPKLDELGGRLRELPDHRLRNSPDYRLRVGDHRIIYSFDLGKNLVFPFSLGRRSQAYR